MIPVTPVVLRFGLCFRERAIRTLRWCWSSLSWPIRLHQRISRRGRHCRAAGSGQLQSDHLAAGLPTLGTLFGGWSFIKALGFGLFRLKTLHAATNQLGATREDIDKVAEWVKRDLTMWPAI
ncbi:MAG: hypothetical protein L3J76_05275 [Candidatus Hydrothermae bacterium]|nr:hypothetical protein [Candidatus Hydrothermae bacterium]